MGIDFVGEDWYSRATKDPGSANWTERATKKLYLPDGSAVVVDVDNRPKVGFARTGSAS